jgi:hypothetical protein
MPCFVKTIVLYYLTRKKKNAARFKKIKRTRKKRRKHVYYNNFKLYKCDDNDGYDDFGDSVII